MKTFDEKKDCEKKVWKIFAKSKINYIFAFRKTSDKVFDFDWRFFKKKWRNIWIIEKFDISLYQFFEIEKNNAEADYAYGAFEMLWNISGVS